MAQRRSSNRRSVGNKNSKTTSTPSRRQRFRARQRNSWITFLGKMLLFVLPVVFLSWWLIVTVLSQGNQLDILVLDLSVGNEAAPPPPRKSLLSVRRYGTEGKNEAGFIKIPEKIHFGGPDKNSLIVFNDLLGSARDIDGENLPCVFIPASEQEHLTHAFYGIPDEETVQHQKQWKPFSKFVEDIASQLAKTVSSKKRVILVFDVDHPDFAGKLPPQANSFIKLCKEVWDEQLNAKLANDYGAKLEFHIWLSHSDGQKSYFDSNPNESESIFKQRFERGISGDIFNWVRKKHQGRHDVRYSDLKNYLSDYVTKDAKLHNLLQAPVCLEPDSFDDFRILRYQDKTDSLLGGVFNYPQRRYDARLDELWQKFAETKLKYSWELENPLAIQQGNMLLLQLERLWYEGKSDTDLFEQFTEKLNRLFDARVTIQPVVHSLRDAEVAQQKASNLLEEITLPEFPIEWLTPIETFPNDEAKNEEASQALDQRNRLIKKWCDRHNDFSAGLKVWQEFLATAEQGAELRPLMAQVFEVLRKPSQRAPDQIGLQQIEFNEFVYLRRILDELPWMETFEDKELFRKTVLLSLKTRDLSNRATATLKPISVQQFGTMFEKLESQRRRLEDQLFAHDGIDEGLATQFANLLQRYQRLQENRMLFENQLRDTLQRLVNSHYQFRYLIGTRASSSTSNPTWVSDFQAALEAIAQIETEQLRSSTPLKQLPFAEEMQALESNFDVASLDVADGNLSGRRLLFWPALDLDKRKTLREGLTKNRIEKDNRKLDEFSSDISGGLTESDLEDLRHHVDSKIQNDIVLAKDKETELLRTARISNRLLLYNEMETTLEKDLSSFINRFHSKKSDLEFRRVANDLWGTKLGSEGSAGTSFVEIATSRHRDTILNRLDALRELKNRQLQSLRGETASAWEQAIKQQWKWQQRISEVATFTESFGYWRREGTTLERSTQDEPFEKELDRQAKTDRNQGFIVSLESQTSNDTLIRKSEIVTDETRTKIGLPEEVIRFGKSVKVYFRGHQCDVNIRRKKSIASQNIVTKFVFDEGIRGTRLEIDRTFKEGTNPIIGEVDILLDCSGSMQGNRLKKVKEYVRSFLESASKREDIKVSIFAFGASFYTDAKGNYKPKPNTSNLSKYKRINGKDDVWRYPKKEAVLLEPATLGGFLEVVDNLQAYGETPIAAALDLALPEKQNQPQLVVLLTDGFEYTKEPGDAEHRPFEPSGARLNQVKQKLQNVLSTLVIFNMVSPDDKNAFANFGGIDYARRIRLINSLSEHRKSGTGGQLVLLKRFLQGILPRPKVLRTPQFGKEVFTEQDKEGIGLKQTIQLGPDDRPENWELLLKFEPEASIRAFQKSPVDWKASSRNFGNEVLSFRYDPLNESFFLVTDWGETREDDKQIKVHNGLEIGVRDNSAKDKPVISVASLDGRELTPAPALVWLELTGPRGSNFIVQDFFLQRQGPGRSNVNSILFPEIQPILENRTLVQRESQLDMKFAWIDRFKPNAWTMIDISKIDTEAPFLRIGNTTQKIKERESLRINDSLIGDEFRDYDFSISRTNLSPDQFSLKLSIQSKAGKKLDRWLVQLLNKEGNEPHRTCRRVSNRSYGVGESVSGFEELQTITHEFLLDREAFSEGATLGIANLDEINKAYPELPNVTFPKSLKALD